MEDKDKDLHIIKIARRHWAKWVLWFFWLIFEIVFLQAAIGSLAEFEPRAAAVYGGIFVALLLTGVFTWFSRRWT